MKNINQRKKYQSQWAAQFYAAAELTRRGYLISLTLGNAPRSDLLAVSPKGTQFKVQVKGQAVQSSWLVQNVDKREKNLYWIFVYLPKPENESPKFFILANREMAKGWRTDPNPRYRYPSGSYWSYVSQYENHWKSLPR